MAEELKAFKREERFIVIKRKHLHSYTESDLRSWLRSNDIPTSECVVVESDWPEYAQVWAMIEARVNGSAQLPSQGGEAVAWRYRHSEQENWHHGDSPKSWWECQPLYTHPADQVADSVVVSREFLKGLAHYLECSSNLTSDDYGSEGYDHARELRALMNGGRS